jgi:hypothetical protein
MDDSICRGSEKVLSLRPDGDYDPKRISTVAFEESSDIESGTIEEASWG